MAKWIFLNLIFLAMAAQFARAEAPVVWSGSTVQWLPSALKSAGICKTDSSGVQTTYTTNGIVKMTGGAPGAAVSGTDFAPATSGSSILKGNGAGGFSSATSGTDYAPATSGSSILKGNGAGGFSSATSGTDFAPATSGSGYQKGNGSGGFTNQATPIPVADGGSGTTTTFTVGSVLFAGASGVYSQDNANFFWDGTNHRLGIGTTSPTDLVDFHNVNDGIYAFRFTGQTENDFSTFSLYAATAGTFGFWNKNLNSGIWNANYLGQMTVGPAAINHPSATLLVQSRNTAWPALAAKAVTSQTAPTFALYDNSETQTFGVTPAGTMTTVNATISALGAGVMRSSSVGVVTSSELTSDVTTSGSNATTVAKIQGTTVSGTTGSGNVVFSTSPTLVTPALGTPSSATLTNATGLPVSSGISGLGSGVATFLATPSSANLAAAITDETGSGAAVFATAPTMTNPVVGTQAPGDNTTKAASTAFVTAAVAAGGSGGLNTARFVLDGAVVPFTTINGSEYIAGTQTLSSVNISALNSGTASTTIKLNQWRSGVLQASATASLASNSSLPNGGAASLSSSLSLLAGDLISVDVISATGASDLTVEWGTVAAVTGGTTLNNIAKTSNYVMTNTDDVIRCNPALGSPVTITMQAVSSATVKAYRVKNIGKDTCTIAPNGSDTFDGDSSIILPSGGSPRLGVELIPDGTSDWSIF